jgi:two-component SAPR family response regulator
MPEIGGRELAETLVARRPSIRVLFMSGYTEDTVLQRDVFRTGIQYLEKPFTPTSLSVKVREVLDRPSRELAVASEV